jgi:hypothetical protein
MGNFDRQVSDETFIFQLLGGGSKHACCKGGRCIMYRRLAVIFPLAALVAFGQDSGGWRKFGTSSSDQAYAVNQALPPQNSQAAPGPNSAPYTVPSQINLPAGTFVMVRVNEKLSSDHNQPGDFFTATLVRPLIANGLVIAQPGQNVAGRVSEALNAKHGNGSSRLGLELTELSLADGQQVPIRTQLMQYQRGSTNGRDVGVMVGTTAAGAAIGAAAGGGLGAGIGAVGGAIAGTIGVAVTHGHATEIHPEATLTFRTIDNVAIATDRSGDAFQPVAQQNYRGQNYGGQQPVQRSVAPPAPYYGYYGGYYDPYYYPYGYYPYSGFYGYGYPGFGVVIRGGGFRGGGFRGGFRGGRR